jgi:hypothetical protein
VQPPPRSSVTLTGPVGVPEEDATVKLTVTATPGSEGSGVSPVIVVLVPPGGGGGGASTSTEAEEAFVAPRSSVAVKITV